ncbi:uncharacterized protein LOC131318664 [Rhododendron vialii]|uniref:uncharacterized protein LOC131318664 n=1 Tax=Rhododendron vialii TaxID=182163 RepID=UPI00265DB132|nr:uncharacterized protein LOC131318664 [Rhododendron vialii]
MRDLLLLHLILGVLQSKRACEERLIFRSEREWIFYVIILDPHLNRVEYDWSYNGSELITTPPALGLRTAILPSTFWEWSYLVDFGHVSGKQYKEHIATLEKCEERYKTVFANKISEFRRACCELFGYSSLLSCWFSYNCLNSQVYRYWLHR